MKAPKEYSKFLPEAQWADLSSLLERAEPGYRRQIEAELDTLAVDPPRTKRDRERAADSIIGRMRLVVPASATAAFAAGDAEVVEVVIGWLRGRVPQEGLDRIQERAVALVDGGALSPRDAEILRLALGLDGGGRLSRGEIARLLGISRERVIQILTRLRDRVRSSTRPPGHGR